MTGWCVRYNHTLVSLVEAETRFQSQSSGNTIGAYGRGKPYIGVSPLFNLRSFINYIYRSINCESGEFRECQGPSPQ